MKKLILLSLLALVSGGILAADSVWVKVEAPRDTIGYDIQRMCPICGKCCPKPTGDSLGCTHVACPEAKPCCNACWGEFRCRTYPDSIFMATWKDCETINWGYWEITDVDTIGVEP